VGKNIDIKRIAKFALFGAVGFGIGGYILSYPIESSSSPTSGFFVSPVVGALGGLTLGLSLNRKVFLFTILGALGFIIGQTLGALVWAGEVGLSDLLFADPNGSSYEAAFTNLLETASSNFPLSIILGASLGGTIGLIPWYYGAKRKANKILGLALAGAIAGIFGALIMFSTNTAFWTQVTIQGLVGGALLGAALGYVEKGNEWRESTSITELERQKPIQNEGESFNYNMNKCPFCNSSNIDEGLMYSWQRVCKDCRKEWNIAHK